MSYDSQKAWMIDNKHYVSMVNNITTFQAALNLTSISYCKKILRNIDYPDLDP
jgi:hypothetical protein